MKDHVKGHAPPRKEKPDPERMAILRSLPVEIKHKITGEEAQAFLYNEELKKKLNERVLFERLTEVLIESPLSFLRYYCWC